MEITSLVYTKLNCKYHIVSANKYKIKKIYNGIFFFGKKYYWSIEIIDN